ncbi:tubulin-folding cofactor B isoform X2 [Malaclemys terrapin pileata]|uniref:tubulin-folding cofactor B isoform X2 n=1 Tax=Malaclemys terrapin pileata TaxID=2991368 RepID=UPI0023A7B45B|nr:tubulin-folding cofactor B isoform X2 [Malaclemys terrapin pileata]
MILSGALGAASPATVSVSISSSLNSFRAQKRYGRGLTIAEFKVIDRSGARVGEYEDVSRVEKYEMSATDYEKRPDSVRSFLKRSKVGKFNEEEMLKKEAEQEQKLTEEKAQAEAISVGARCEVRVSGQPNKRGTVMFVGLAEFKPGYWIGIKYDEPLGKNDGSVNGKQYFECQPKYGAFVKPQYVTVGDFPEEDYGLDDEM